MTTTATAALLNLLGYVTGAALYAMLLVMVGKQARVAASWRDGADRLPLLTALLGLAWNVGALSGVGLQGGFAARWQMALWLWPLVNAAAFTALGFLPAVVVHALLRTRDGLQARRAALAMTMTAYALSATAGVLHVQHAVVNRFAPSHWALHVLTVGFVGLIGALLTYTRRQPEAVADTRWKGAGWALALAVFAVSALHLSHHEGQDYSWWIELIGHHASLPLALAILYQDYRFALADIFLKRALALVLLVALACGLYLLIAAPLLARRGTQGEGAALGVGLLLGLWVATALVYPLLRRMVNRFVDAIVLRRADYEAVRVEIAQGLAAQDAPAAVLAEVCASLSAALTARQVDWTPLADDETPGQDRAPSGPLLPLIEQRKYARRLPKLREATPRVATNVELPAREHAPDWRHATRTSAIALVPTTEAPQYRLLIGDLAAGRRLLSDDLALIEAAAVLAARRIDQVRVLHERCARDLHEQEIRKLATEAELRALRAQINPHFLFNALTTIGYLIQAAPERALTTLLRLTSLLRGVLRQSDGEFSTLGDEIELIESYLDIERARFEDRLRVVIDVPDDLRSIRIPALLLQPLVENAIKHGIAPQRAGGEVMILARLGGDAQQTATPKTGADTLQLWVRDTGAGVSQSALEHGSRRGVGLTNVEQRIHRHYGVAGVFNLRSAPGVGTTVELELPVNPARSVTNEADAAREAMATRRRLA